MFNADFTSDEYVRRCEKAQRLMKDADIDVLLINGMENLAYFSGFRKPGIAKSTPYCMIVSRETSATLVAPLTSRGNIEEMSWLFPDGIRFWGGGPSHVGLPKNFFDAINHLIRDIGLTKERIGLESGRLMRLGMTLTDLETLKRELPQAQFVDAADLIWELRMVKSPREIDYLRKACEITCKALETGIQSAKEGMTEREFARIVYKVMIEEGGEDDPLTAFQHVRSGPERYRVLNSRPSNKKMKKGDLVAVDLGAFYRGYYADMIRMFCIGAPSDKQKELFEVAFQAQEAGVQALRPGVKANEIYSSAMSVIEEAGYMQNTFGEDVGHGLGMDIHEPPIFHFSQAVETLRPGMVVTVEPSLYDTPVIKGIPGGIGVFFVEDDILITETGHEILTPMEKDLWIV